MNTPSESICAYLRAKDGNRPHLLAQAFADDALLEMRVKTGAISFPPVSQGRSAIAEVLVRRFAQTYENVYTFCLAPAPKAQDGSFTCDWLVAMTEKESGAVRVGCGRYDWWFSPNNGLAERLVITIETMQSLPPKDLDSIMNWVSELPCPWCAPRLAMRDAPDISELGPVFDYIRRNQDFTHSFDGEQRLACHSN